MPGPREAHSSTSFFRCDSANVFLMLVLDLAAATVHGHHLLDLNQVYGLKEAPAVG